MPIRWFFKREMMDKYLAVARLLYEKVPLPGIQREVKGIGGPNIGMVKHLMTSNYITVDETTHEAKFTAPPEEIEAYLDEVNWQKTGKRAVKTPTVSAEEAVETVIKKETAQEATARTSQYMQIGKTVAQAYWKWAQKMGIPIEEAVKHDIGKIVKDALDYHAKGKHLESRVGELEDALRMAVTEVDPIVRLKTACTLVYKFLEFATLAEIVGFDIEGSPLVEHYQNLIESYLKGGYT
jgi:hypothetical protein